MLYLSRFLTCTEQEMRACYNINRYDYKMPEEIPDFSIITKSLINDFKAFTVLLLKLTAVALGKLQNNNENPFSNLFIY